MKKQIIKLLLISFVSAVTVGFFLHFKPSLFSNLLSDLQSYNGVNAVFLISATYLLSNLLFLPLGLPLNFLAGMLWGTFLGGILINILATIVAAVSFLLARKFE